MGVLCVCLHIYRYIGTYIDRSKIAHASAHTSIYMHRFIIYDFTFFFFFSLFLFSFPSSHILMTIIVYFTCKNKKFYHSGTAYIR